MANIVLLYKCNLHCSYCFANEFVNKKTDMISFENFLKAYHFIQQTPKERMGLIGGEPTLHPDFARMIEFLNSENKKEKFKIPIQIFTNGIELDKYMDLFRKGNYAFLINCNSPENIGETNYKRLRENIRLLEKYYSKKFIIGINLYSNQMNYDYIFDILKDVKKKVLRLSLTVPNDASKKTPSLENAFGVNKEFLFGLIKKCKENNVTPFYDCNTFVTCLVDKEDIKLIKSFPTRFNMLCYSACCPIIDILPDLKAIRCFGLSEYLKVPISDFKDVPELREFFETEIDYYAKSLPTFEQCKGCKSLKSQHCYGGCLSYKIDKIDKFKQYCNEFVEKI